MLKTLISAVMVTLASAEAQNDAILTPRSRTNEPTCEQQCVIIFAYDQNEPEYEACLAACNPPPPVDCSTCQPCGSERDTCSAGCLITYLYDQNQKNYNDCCSWCN